MQLQHHLTQVSEQIGAAAALGDDRTKEIAAALGAAATPAVRLALLSAVSEAADEITAALLDYPGSPAVDVRVDGEDIALQVRATHPGAEQQDAPRRDEGDASARISLRLTEALKTEIDDAAEREGISVNTWLVRAATKALQPNPFEGFAAAFGPGFAANVGGGGPGRNRRGDQHITGWING